MKLRLQEDPKEWRKSAWLTAGGVVFLTSVLRWRKVFATPVWLGLVGAAGVAAICAWAVPRWFRGYYRFSHRLGFHLAGAIGYVVLSVFFVLVITPMGLVLRLCGQDPLRLKRRGNEESYWHPAPKKSPLDRLF